MDIKNMLKSIGLGIAVLLLAGCGQKECLHPDSACEEVDRVSANCVNPGYIEYHCNECNQNFQDEIAIDPSAHKAVESDDDACVDKTAESMNSVGCGEEYIVYGRCKNCNRIVEYTRENKPPHNYEQTIEYKNVLTEHHTKVTGGKCTICGRWDPLTYKEEEEAHNAKSSVLNMTLAHEMGACKAYDNECDCGLKYNTTQSHAWGIPTVTYPVTCTTDGNQKYECLTCHETKNETIYSTGHTFTDELKYAYCVDRTCTVCNEKIEASGDHIPGDEEPCCDQICLLCGKLLAEHTEEHEYDTTDTFPCHDHECIKCHSEQGLIKASEHTLEGAPCESRVCKVCGDTVAPTKKHTVATGTTICQVCHHEVVLKKPEIYFDEENEIICSKVQPEYTVFYLNGKKFDGTFKNEEGSYDLPEGIYTITAKNIDPDGILPESELSEELIVWIVFTNPIHAETSNYNFKSIVKVELSDLNFAGDYWIHAKYYDSDGELIEDHYYQSSKLKPQFNDRYQNLGEDKDKTAYMITYELCADPELHNAYFLFRIFEEWYKEE